GGGKGILGGLRSTGYGLDFVHDSGGIVRQAVGADGDDVAGVEGLVADLDLPDERPETAAQVPDGAVVARTIDLAVAGLDLGVLQDDGRPQVAADLDRRADDRELDVLVGAVQRNHAGRPGDLLRLGPQERSGAFARQLEPEEVLHPQVVEDHLDLGLDLDEDERAAAPLQHAGEVHEVAESRAVHVRHVLHQDGDVRDLLVERRGELVLQGRRVGGVDAALDDDFRGAGQLQDRVAGDAEVGHGEVILQPNWETETENRKSAPESRLLEELRGVELRGQLLAQPQAGLAGPED